MARLGDICTIQSGGTPSRHNKAYWDDGTIPWVKISDIKDKYLDATEERITKLGLENSSAKALPIPDVAPVITYFFIVFIAPHKIRTTANTMLMPKQVR